MPSAASVKVENSPTTNISANNAVAAKEAAAQSENVDNSSPVRQISLIIEHKIRNLEKRKSKLESYRDLEKTGKDLSADKKIAILKYDEVAMTLEFAREFSKQIDKVVISSEKDLKKKQKKDESLKKQNETSKVREVLVIQDILNVLKDEAVRNEFLAGTKGAYKLEQSDFELLDLFASKILPKHSTEKGSISFKNSCQKAADILSLTVDGKQKEFESSTTYANIKILLKNIQKSAYYEKLNQNQSQQPAELVENSSDVSGEVNSNEEVNTDASPEENIVDSTTISIEAETMDTQGESTAEVDYQEAPSASAVPVPTFTPQQTHAVSAQGITAPQNLKSLPQVPVAAGGSIPLSVPPSQQIHTGHIPPTVRAVESAYFKQHQYIQPMARPLAEVLGTGNFYFLQDSELDSPDVPNNMTAHQNQNMERPAVCQIGPQQPIDPLSQSNISPNPQLQMQRIPQLQPEIPQQMHNQPPQTLQNQQVNATYWKSPGVSGIDTKSVGTSAVEAKSTGVSATFNNQSFPLIHNHQSSFPNVEPSTQQQHHQQQQQAQQAHIPGFATPNAPIPMPAQLPSLNQSVPQQTTSPNANQVLVQQSQPFIPASKFVNQTNLATNITENNTLDLHSNTADIKENEWKADDITHVTSKLNNNSLDHPHKTNLKTTISNGNNSAWRDPYATSTNKNSQENNEWNGVPNENDQDDSNTWASGTTNQRYQYRQGSGIHRSSASKPSFSKNAPSNYRGRSNGSYNGNGNNSGNGVGNSRTNGNGNSSAFYRNNDNFYQNGSRTDKSADHKNGGATDVKNFSANRYRGNPQRSSNNANSQSSNNKKNFNFVR